MTGAFLWMKLDGDSQCEAATKYSKKLQFKKRKDPNTKIRKREEVCCSTLTRMVQL